MNFFKKLRKSKKGATAIEYGLIAALIAVGIIAAATALGGNLQSTFNRVAASLSGATTGSATP